jgi:hypothetical protein
MAGCPEKAQGTSSEKSEGRKAMGALGRTGGKEDRGIPDKIRFRPEKKNALPVLMQPSSTTSRSLNNRENRDATIFSQVVRTLFSRVLFEQPQVGLR